jgi:glycerol-3-phosphate dehydrogenase
MLKRETAISHLKQNPELDVLIIGAGVNGIGTFRDLVLQGLSVLIVDKADFCSGASAGSSHMLHGGIRYLENGEFRLVREALHERNLLLKNAPHYAKPLPTTIPIFKWFSGLFNAPFKFLGLLEKPSERGAIVIKLGLILYDWFTGPQQSMPFHRFSNRASSLKHYPKLNPNIVATATYYDAYMPYPERLCIDLLRDAQNTSETAWALNYASAESATSDSVVIRDLLSGDEITVKPKVVINAAGPWIDFVNRALGQTTKFIGGTKGSHLILDNPELLEAAANSEIFFESEDGRILLILPYLGKVMLGTTDIRIDDPDKAVCDPAEEEYILTQVKRVFPNIHVDSSQIIFRFSGVRPLPASTDKRTGAISRDHSIQSVKPSSQHQFPIHSLVGGKWTTFRAFSEQAADQALRDLNATRKLDTAGLPIGDGDKFPTTEKDRQEWLEKMRKETELELSHLSLLLDRYGVYAEEVARFMSAANDQPLAHAPHYTQREILFIVENEAVHRIDDILLRRSALAMLGYHSPELVKEIGALMGQVLGWDEERLNAEVDYTLSLLSHKHGVTYPSAALADA